MPAGTTREPLSDDERFEAAMLDFDRRHAAALAKRREREAAGERRRMRSHRHHRYTVTEGGTPARILALLQSDSRPFSVQEIVADLCCPANRVYVSLHTLVARELIQRTSVGWYTLTGIKAD